MISGFPFKRFLLAGLLCALWLPATALAVPDPVAVQAEIYAVQKMLEAQTKLGAAAQQAANPRGNLPYQGGNNMANIAIEMVDDYLRHFLDFHLPNPLGRDWRLDGICIRWTWTGPKFYPFIRYRFPMVMAEVTSLFRGQYAPDLLMDLYEDFYDNFYDQIASNEAGREVVRAQRVISESTFNPILSLGIDGPSTNRSSLTTAPEGMRKRGSIQSAGAHGANYNIFLTLAGLTRTPVAAGGNCHDTPLIPPAPGVFYSASPAFLSFTHLNKWSDFFFPAQMAALYNAPGADPMIANTCIINNVVKGKSPASRLEEVISNPALGVAKPNALCAGTLGARFPITTRLQNTRSPYNASRLSFLRGITFFRRFPSMMDFAYFDPPGTEQEDHVKFHFPPQLPGGIGGLQRSSHFTDQGYRGDNYEADPNRTVLTVWKWVRCCRRGRPWIVWSGNKTQYRGRHQFSGGRFP